MGTKTDVSSYVAMGSGPEPTTSITQIGGTTTFHGGAGGYSPASPSGPSVENPGGKNSNNSNPTGGDYSGGGYSGGGGGYSGLRVFSSLNGGLPSAEAQAEAEAAAKAEAEAAAAVRDKLLNTEANTQANKDMLKLAGYDLENPPKGLDVPGQVALPNRIDLPNVALPNRIDLPDEVDYGEALDFQRAMQEADVNIGRVNNVDTHPEEEMLQQLTDAQRQQAILQADRAVETGTTQLQRQMQDAQQQFQTQQNQIAIDEQRALDNQALYAEARGDRGGIGQAQYNSIQNTAATNRLTVQQEQTQLATDTARQIADLRAQGEFEKANQLLSISQQHLSQLMNLYQWAKEANIGIDEFNLQVAQWEESYKLNLVDAQLEVQNSNLNLAQAKVAQAQQRWANEYQQENSLYNAAWNQATDLFNAAYNQENSQFEARRNATNDYFNNQLNTANYGINASKAALEAQLNAANATGAFLNGTPTYAAQQQTREILAASGQALLEKGIIPSAEQLLAMGMTAGQAAQITGAAGIGAGASWNGDDFGRAKVLSAAAQGLSYADSSTGGWSATPHKYQRVAGWQMGKAY